MTLTDELVSLRSYTTQNFLYHLITCKQKKQKQLFGVDHTTQIAQTKKRAELDQGDLKT